MLKGLLLTLAVWAVGAAMLRVTVATPHQCPDVSLEILRSAETAASTWMTANQFEDGSYVYEYDVASDSFPGGYNEVRHAGVTMSLYQLAANGDLSVLPVADAAMERMENSLRRGEGWAIWRRGGASSVAFGG